MRMLTTGQAARALGVHLNTIKRWIRSGFLKANPSYGRYKIPESEVWRLGGPLEGRVYTTSEAAGKLGKSPSTVKRMIRAGKVHALMTPGGHYRIPESGIRELLPERIPEKRRGVKGTKPGGKRRRKAKLPPVPDLSFDYDPYMFGTKHAPRPSERRRSFHKKAVVHDRDHKIIRQDRGGCTIKRKGTLVGDPDFHEEMLPPIGDRRFPYPSGYLQLRGRRLYLQRVSHEYHWLGQPHSASPSAKLTPLIDLTEEQSRLLFVLRLKYALLFIDFLLEAGGKRCGKAVTLFPAWRGPGRKRRGKKEPKIAPDARVADIEEFIKKRGGEFGRKALWREYPGKITRRMFYDIIDRLTKEGKVTYDVLDRICYRQPGKNKRRKKR